MKRLVLMLCVLGIATLACGGTPKTVTLIHPINKVVQMWDDNVEPSHEIPVGTRCSVLGEFTYEDAIGKLFYYKLDCLGNIGYVLKDFCE